jgi:hypothetical protein
VHKPMSWMELDLRCVANSERAVRMGDEFFEEKRVRKIAAAGSPELPRKLLTSLGSSRLTSN